MNAHQHIDAVSDVAFHQGHVVLAVQLVHEGVGAKRPVARGHCRIGHFHHVAFVLLAVVLERFDGDELQIELPGELYQLGCAHHGAVFAHDLAAQTALLKTGQTHQIHCGLGVAVALQHAVGLCHQWEHMARPAEVGRAGAGLHHGARGQPALLRRDARCGVDVVDGHGEGGFVVVGVLGDHLGKRQLLAQFGGHGHADEPLAVYCHEVHVLGGGELRCADEIAFVLAVGVVGAQNDLARAQIIQRLFDRAELE